MPWNRREFMQELAKCGDRYEADNAWFKKDWGEQRLYAMNAWKLYEGASTNALGMLLLGSAKIRMDPELVSNFGVASAGGVGDGEEAELVDALEAERTNLRASPGMRDAPSVLGPGSILNDKNWTPLLNDSYILGGVHGEHEFHFAEETANAHFASLSAQLNPRREVAVLLQDPRPLLERGAERTTHPGEGAHRLADIRIPPAFFQRATLVRRQAI